MVNSSSEVIILGTGSPRREFLFSDDLANACFFLMHNFDESGFINIGTGHDITIKELALLIQKVVGFEGELVFDTSQPDGTPRKLMDVSKLNSKGWHYQVELEQGIRLVYEDFKNNYS
jgi:GDP-L-fucose synthase